MNVVKKLSFILFSCLCVLMLPSCIKNFVPASNQISVKRVVPVQDEQLQAEQSEKYEIYAEDGMTKQNEHLVDSVSSVLRLRKKQRQTYIKQKYGVRDVPESLGDKLALVLEQEVKSLGSNICVDCDVEPMGDEHMYRLKICNERSGNAICGIDVKPDNGTFSSSGYINPYNDGCVQSSVTGKLHVCKPLESVFVANGKNIVEGKEDDFVSGDRNVYKVRQFPGLWQEVSGPCGYYALFHLDRMIKSMDANGNLLDLSGNQLFDRAEYENFFCQCSQELPHIRKRNSSEIALSNREMKKLIKRRIKSLHKENVAISFSEINHLEPSYSNTFTDGMLTARIQDFRNNGTPQYLVIGSGEKSKNVKNIKGLKLCWDDRLGRKSCLSGHWFAMSIAWAGKPQKSPVIITLADSGMIRDSRYASIIHWYYQVFVQNKV